jgi:hypothetical protein
MRVRSKFLDFIGRHRFVVLFVALLVFLLLVPIIHEVHAVLPRTMPPLVEALVFLAVLAGAVASISNTTAWKWFALGLGLPAAVLGALHTLVESMPVEIIRHLFGVAFLGYVMAVMLRFTLTRQQVTFNTVCASLCIYLLLGIVWALGYAVLHMLDPTAFRGTSGVGEGSAVLFRIGKGYSTSVLYFSFTTLTTLGYGDIVPVSPTARMLTSVEAITGQLYLTVLVARLVGLHIAESSGQERQAPERAAGQAEEQGKQ